MGCIGQMDFLTTNEQCQSTEHNSNHKIEDGDFDPQPSIDVDAFATDCRDLDLWPQNLIRSSAGDQWIFSVSAIEIAQAIHEISWQNLSGRTNEQDERGITPYAPVHQPSSLKDM